MGDQQRMMRDMANFGERMGMTAALMATAGEAFQAGMHRGFEAMQTFMKRYRAAATLEAREALSEARFRRHIRNERLTGLQSVRAHADQVRRELGLPLSRG